MHIQKERFKRVDILEFTSTKYVCCFISYLISIVRNKTRHTRMNQSPMNGGLLMCSTPGLPSSSSATVSSADSSAS